MKAVWQGLARALDGTPPGFYVIERRFVGLSANKEIGLRLPSILAFPVHIALRIRVCEEAQR